MATHTGRQVGKCSGKIFNKIKELEVLLNKMDLHCEINDQLAIKTGTKMKQWLKFQGAAAQHQVKHEHHSGSGNA